MSIINTTAIREGSFNQKAFQKGMNYYESGRVQYVEFDASQNQYHAIVQGENNYDVNIYLRGARVGDVGCSCPAYFSYFGYCKHIVAVLLHLTEYNSNDSDSSVVTKQELSRDKESMSEIIRVFQNLPEEVSQEFRSEPLHVHYVLGMTPTYDGIYDMWFTLRLKVGCERLYVVKNIGDFLNAYRDKAQLFFTNIFVYNPLTQQPDAEDEKMLQFLVKLSEDERLYSSMLDLEASGKDQRMLIIPPNRVKDFLAVLPKGRYLFEHREKRYTELVQVDNENPFSFSLTKDEEGQFGLESGVKKEDERGQTGIRPYLLSHEGHCFDSGRIFQLNQTQREVILPLHRKIQQKPRQRIFISQEQMDHFVSTVLPVLKKEAHLEIDPEIANKIVEFPLKAEVYLDRVQDEGYEKITATIMYVYGETRINSLLEEVTEQSSDGVMLVRDNQKEQQIMNIFEDAEFKYNGQQLYLEGEDAVFRFLYRQIPRLKKVADIYETDLFSQISIQSRDYPVPRVDIGKSLDWMEFSFDVPDTDETELENILKAFVEKKSYYRLSDGSFIPLMEEGLRSFLNEGDGFLEGSTFKLPAYRALQLDGLSMDEMELKKGSLFRRLVRNIKDPENLDFAPPDSMDLILRDYQRIGFQWMKTLSHYQFSGILADDMGLGKTLQALAFIASECEKDTSVKQPALVIAPASLLYNWEKECARFVPHLKTAVIAGTKQEREELLENGMDVDVLITSYPLLRRDSELYTSRSFRTLILDEAQFFKNHTSQTFRCIKAIRSATRFALSGTPIENSLGELWAVFNVILPGLLPSKSVFNNLSTEQITRRVRPFILRRMKKDVLNELPDKIESIQLSELTEDQKKVYLATLQKIQKDTAQSIQSEGFQKTRMKILAGLTRLRQICCHPSLYLENYSSDSGKYEQFLELLRELRQNGHRVLVFSQFTSMLSIIQQELQREEISYHYIDGSTPVKERLNLVDRFNEGEKDLFLISLKAGGTGLNLTGADTVILYDLWWNPAVEQQAIDRAHRMGQKRVVQVFRLISKGTIEEKIFELQQKKKALFDQVIQPGEERLSSLSESDIREILGL